MALWLEVNRRSGVPIYVQLVEGIRHTLEVGLLGSGEKLPTVRALAGELTVAPNTVVKAYNELQRMGLIESKPGVGTVVVAGSGEAVRAQQVEALYERLGVLVRDAVGLEVAEDELWERFDAEFEHVYSRAASRERERSG
jgi:GntR family transcriptional regulator